MFISCHEKEAFPFIAPKTTLAAFKGFSKKRGPQNRLYKLYRLARHVKSFLFSFPLPGGRPGAAEPHRASKEPGSGVPPITELETDDSRLLPTPVYILLVLR